jgi:hypothetical protein
MAEAVLLGLSHKWNREFTGPVTEERIATLESLAIKYGFGLAASKELCVFGSGAFSSSRLELNSNVVTS